MSVFLKYPLSESPGLPSLHVVPGIRAWRQLTYNYSVLPLSNCIHTSPSPGTYCEVFNPIPYVVHIPSIPRDVPSTRIEGEVSQRALWEWTWKSQPWEKVELNFPGAIQLPAKHTRWKTQKVFTHNSRLPFRRDFRQLASGFSEKLYRASHLSPLIHLAVPAIFLPAFLTWALVNTGFLLCEVLRMGDKKIASPFFLPCPQFEFRYHAMTPCCCARQVGDSLFSANAGYSLAYQMWKSNMKLYVLFGYICQINPVQA